MFLACVMSHLSRMVTFNTVPSLDQGTTWEFERMRQFNNFFSFVSLSTAGLSFVTITLTMLLRIDGRQSAFALRIEKAYHYGIPAVLTATTVAEIAIWIALDPDYMHMRPWTILIVAVNFVVGLSTQLPMTMVILYKLVARYRSSQLENSRTVRNSLLRLLLSSMLGFLSGLSYIHGTISDRKSFYPEYMWVSRPPTHPEYQAKVTDLGRFFDVNVNVFLYSFLGALLALPFLLATSHVEFMRAWWHGIATIGLPRSKEATKSSPAPNRAFNGQMILKSTEGLQ